MTLCHILPERRVGKYDISFGVSIKILNLEQSYFTGDFISFDCPCGNIRVSEFKFL